MKSLLNAQQFIAHPIHFLDRQFASGRGDIQTVKLGPKRFHLVFEPSMAHEVLTSKASVFVQNRSIFDRIKPITGEQGLVQLNGVESQHMRQRTRAMLVPQNLKALNQVVLTNTEKALASIEGNVDITKVMFDLVLKNAFAMFLGLNLEQEVSGIAQEFKELNERCGKRMLSVFPLPAGPRIHRLKKSLRKKILSALDQKEQQLVNVYQIFQHDDSLVDQCMTFLFAGHETTASSLAFTFLLLGLHPEYQKRIRDEGEAMALKVYKESLRLFPPAYMLAREASETLKFHGVDIKRGDQLIIGVKQIHHDPRFHARAEHFNPERFNEHIDAFLPFGLGPKSCIGERLAYLEAVTIISYFCQYFEFITQSKEIGSKPLVTLHPKEQQHIAVKKIC